MGPTGERAVAIVGLGAMMPDAGDARAFWQNIKNERYSISEVPPERWRVEDYYDPDPAAPDKTYSKIGSWVRGYQFDWKQHRIPPKVAAAMDEGQQWAVTVAAQALDDYGYPNRPLDNDRTGVILGTAIGGELHYMTALRIMSPELMRLLDDVDAFRGLPEATRRRLLLEWRQAMSKAFPEITEDTMPGELPNIIAGRVANVLNLRGPNFITDAACASSFAAVASAIEMLAEGRCDAVVAGGVERNMGPTSFVKFSKIGALSATGTRPFADGADGFVMGEGAAAFLLKRLADAEAAGDRIYAVIRGAGGSSDGKGKGITAPNPVGQVLASRRAWENAGLDPATATMLEAHGTSTKVGDVTEVESLAKVFAGASRGSIALGSVKSNIGHLKAAAGAAGLLKTVWATHERVLPPTLNARPSNPKIDFSSTPFELNHELREWSAAPGQPRRAGVSAYGFGGTNFHLVIEEHVPGMLRGNGHRQYAGVEAPAKTATGTASFSLGNPSTSLRTNGASSSAAAASEHSTHRPAPLQGILALSASDAAALNAKVEETLNKVANGWAPPRELPDAAAVAGAERIVIDFADRKELEERLIKARKAIGLGTPAAWKPLAPQGIFRGSGPKPGKIAFLFPGQGSQTLNMARKIAVVAPSVAAMFAEADEIMQPILGRPLSRYVWVDATDPEQLKRAEDELRQTAITQPAMLTVDAALQRLLADYGFRPDYVMGHSLGEYAALVASGAMPFAHALEATAARGQEMTRVSVADPGWMAAVIGPYEIVERTLKEIDGYVVAANLNSHNQTVIGGTTEAVKAAIERFNKSGLKAMRIPVSHAFHTQIVASAAKPMRQVLDRLSFSSPQIPVIANVTGDVYPSEPERVKDYLERQIASPVQWAKGLETLYAHGVRVFMEVGPKKVLKGFVDNVLNGRPNLVSLFTNHPDFGEIAMFNQAICGLYAASYAPAGTRTEADTASSIYSGSVRPVEIQTTAAPAPAAVISSEESMTSMQSSDTVNALAQLLAQALQSAPSGAQAARPYDRSDVPLGSVVISGAGLGLPGTRKRFMDPDNALRILRGEQFIELLPESAREAMVSKRITRLMKTEDGSGSFETIEDTADVIKLAGQAGPFDLSEEFGVPEKLVEALDLASQIAMAAGLDALHEAGIPLVQTFKKTSKGTYLPDRFILPEALRDETGVIFASAFPGLDRFASELKRYHRWEGKLQQLAALEDLREYASDDAMLREIDRRIHALRDEMKREPYTFDRRFLFRVLSMGHSQFAEFIGARGPNTQVNAACASTAQAVALAEDWIRAGRCRRVLVLGGDATTSENMVEWMAAGFLSAGAAATDERVQDAALPFDRRRHGMLTGIGSVALLVESEDAVRERGMRGIAEVLATETANSAFHGTRLDVEHITLVMERLLSSAERRFGINRYGIAAQTVFMSHETFTPARGGSAAAEVTALRRCFGPAADEVVVCNTKGLTGHTMGAGVEDVVAVKALEHGLLPPVPNFKEPDPELGALNLSRGGRYGVQYALRLAAGFGSQISMTLARRIPGGLDRVDDKGRYGRWLADVSGYDRPELEVVKRTLRIKGEGLPQRMPAGSTWQYGTGPVVRAAAPGDAAGAHRPMPLAAVTKAMRQAPPVEQVQEVPAIVPVASPAVEIPTPIEPAPAPTLLSAAPAAGPAATVVESVVVVDRRLEHEDGKTPWEKPVVIPAPKEPTRQETADPVTAKVLEIVAAKTGYPQDMLDLELDLEADLGIDTVKQAETFAAIREAFGIALQENVSLRDYPSLRSVAGFVYQFRPDLATEVRRGEVSSPLPLPASQPVAQSANPVTTKVLEIVAAKTGYPQDMLDLELDLEADLGIDTVKQAETFAAIREAFTIPLQENISLRDYPTLQNVVGFVYQFRPDLATNFLEVRRGEVASPLPAPASLLPMPAFAATGGETLPPKPMAQSVDPVTPKVLEIVAAKTGYPQDLLDLELDLEADLGIDTVKQAETFAAIREAFNIPVQDDISLRDYPTLQSVVGFVYKFRPDLATGARRGEAPSPSTGDADTGKGGDTPPLRPAVEGIDPVTPKVLAIVADKTGYPQDMLDLELDLEADLGIDTVKQAETFAAIREAFSIPFQESLPLRDYPTLQSVVGFVYKFRPDLATGNDVTSSARGAEASNAEGEDISPPQAAAGFAPEPVVTGPRYSIEDANRIPRRVPVPTLRPGLDICKPTRVKLGSGARVVVMFDEGGVGKALESRLRKLGVTILAIQPGVATDELDARLKGWLADGPIQGIYWLAALDVEPALDQLTLDGWREVNRRRVKNLYIAMRGLYDAIAGPGTFLVSATRLGGLHGYGPGGATAPAGGAVAGFTKAYAMEQDLREGKGEGLTVKVVDFEGSTKAHEVAATLIDEALHDPGVIEVGQHAGLRYSVTLQEQPAQHGGPGLQLSPTTVFLVTGAAGGITSEIVADLAGASHGVFYLLDLAAQPARDDRHIALFRQGRESLKAALIEEARGRGEKPTPVAIDKQIAGIERSEAALRAVEAVEAAGGVPHYYSLDLRDAEACAAVMADVRTRYGHLDVFVHAGGLLVDRTLPNKEPAQFDLVFDVKADGWFNLMRAAGDLPVGATVAFSSVAGRFGNNGQTDYSAANDLLCKLTSNLLRTRPATRGIAIDWTAWGGIGMASRGSVPQIMEALGVDMLPPESGVPTVRRELISGNATGEVVVAGRLGAWLEERDPNGGLDVEKASAYLAARKPRLPLVGKIVECKLYGGRADRDDAGSEGATLPLRSRARPRDPLAPGSDGYRGAGRGRRRARTRLPRRCSRERADARRVQVLPNGAADFVRERCGNGHGCRRVGSAHGAAVDNSTV